MELQGNVRSRAAVRSKSSGHGYRLIKRLTDVIVSFLLLLVLSPLLIFIYQRIKKKEGSPSIYRETRMGKDLRTFVMWRFRTMTNPSRVIFAFPPHPVPVSWKDGVPDKFTIQRDAGISLTSTGLWIRKYHFHILPQLWNVFKGEMSLVGPRAEIPEIVDYYNRHQTGRLKVKPGMVGYVDLYEDKLLNHNEKVNLDLYYIKKRSYKMDAGIFFRVISKRLKMRVQKRG